MKLPILACAVLLLAYGASAAPSQSEATRLGEGAPGDDDPRISPEEVFAPSIEADDPAWTPIYEEAEDPATIQCGGREACEEYKQDEVRQEAATRTTTGAPR